MPKWSRCLDLDDIADQQSAIAQSPYGVAGDFLYVRETWRYDFVRETKTYTSVGIVYKADDACLNIDLTSKHDLVIALRQISGGRSLNRRWRPSIHMPKSYSRVYLKNLGVRIERIHDISNESAKAEGVEPRGEGPDRYRLGFSSLWNQINLKRGCWDSNPHVFVIRFKLAKCHTERAV